MRTRIISAFPGMGKTYFHENSKYKTLDSDSSKFSWLTRDGEKVRNLSFPENYISHIKENIGKYDFILVSSHKEVRDALLDNCIFFYLIYPSNRMKDEMIQRYKDRGSDQKFIELIDKNYEQWIKELSFCNTGCQNISSVLGYLENEISHIVCSENGDTID